jgi:hypothetical protein
MQGTAAHHRAAKLRVAAGNGSTQQQTCLPIEQVLTCTALLHQVYVPLVLKGTQELHRASEPAASAAQGRVQPLQAICAEEERLAKRSENCCKQFEGF